MRLFRSEEMQLVQLIIPAEAAHDTMCDLGDLGMLQFKDLNAGTPAFQRAFASQIKRCDEMARQLRFLGEQLERAGLGPPPPGAAPSAEGLDALEARLARLERELLELNASAAHVARSRAELLELQLVLETAGRFFAGSGAAALFGGGGGSAGGTPPSDAGGTPLLETPLLEDAPPPREPRPLQLGFAAGTVAAARLPGFERLLFRATRGNVFVRAEAVGALDDPATGERVEKAVFGVFFSGERARQKVVKICEAYGANRYPLPEDPAQRAALGAEVVARLRELAAAADAGERLRGGALAAAAAGAGGWAARVRREKAVHHALNKLSADASRKALVGRAWMPAAAAPAVRAALAAGAARGGARSGAALTPVPADPRREAAPTFHSTGKVARAFQDIVDAYGTARYREANPAVLTIVTFPFLFAVMFGDVGHGALLALFAAVLVLNERALGGRDLGDILGMMFGGRYVLALMAAFSIYTGLIYNEYFSIAGTLFGRSAYACATDGDVTSAVEMQAHPELCPSAFRTGLAKDGATYAFGVDPAWHGTRTELPFLNSVKMKMSILLGVAQMNAGIVLSLLNQRHYGDRLSTLFEFIPQMVFLNCLFGYLCLLVLAKWATGSTADLYHTMIYMFLTPGDVDCSGACPENKMFPGQGGLQVLLLLAAFVSVPVMLLPKPLILKKRHEERTAAYGLLSAAASDDGGEFAASHLGDPDVAEGDAGGHAHGHGGDEFDFGEVMVHQMIHTIEFVLGAVSNTASYLRLWALSLAHSQLSAVFYDRVLMAAVRSGSPAAVVVGFFVFACATLGVLMVMESLSAFLHALRLHWVEFMNKFYSGDGQPFTPFSLADGEAG